MNETDEINLKYLIQNELFKTVPLVPTKDFISYCKDRDISISDEKLEKYEELGIFYPLARVKRPKIKIKIEYSEDRKQFKELGILKENEIWDGEVEEEIQMFSFPDDAKEWFKEGLIWDPKSLSFEKWDNFVDENGNRLIENYYSIFQCYHILLLEQWFKRTVHSVELVSYDEEDVEKLINNMMKYSHWIVSKQKENMFKYSKLPLICQVLSNRYYPLTQTDQRHFTLTLHGFFSNEWDWHDYCRSWEPEKILADLNLKIEEIKNLQNEVSSKARFTDPLVNWYELVAFISVDKKEKLKGAALFAQTLYSIENMLRLFYEDITKEKLPAFDETHQKWKERFYGIDVEENSYQYLQYLINRYHLNPKPSLLLIVEGDGEEKEIPRLASELFRIKFANFGIELINLKGVGNFEGKKSADKYGALEKLIDDYHYRQTIVFLILDNEGRVSDIKNRLISKPSRYYPNRTVTKEEYIFLWDKNIEFDNFSCEEIAQSMTKLSGGKYTFNVNEVEECKNNFGEKGNPLQILSKDKLNYSISKIELLEDLFNVLIDSGCKLEDLRKRPIVSLLEKIIDLSRKNSHCQPISLSNWKKNQESGFFGEKLKD